MLRSIGALSDAALSSFIIFSISGGAGNFLPRRRSASRFDFSDMDCCPCANSLWRALAAIPHPEAIPNKADRNARPGPP